MSVKRFGPKSNVKTNLGSENCLRPQKFGQEKIWSKKKKIFLKIWGPQRSKKKKF